MEVEAGIDTPFRFARKGSGLTAADVGSPVFAGGALNSQNRGAIHLAAKLRALRGGHDEIVSVGVNERSRNALDGYCRWQSYSDHIHGRKR